MLSRRCHRGAPAGAPRRCGTTALARVIARRDAAAAHLHAEGVRDLACGWRSRLLDGENCRFDPVMPPESRGHASPRARDCRMVAQTGPKSHPGGSSVPQKRGETAVLCPKSVIKMQRLPGKRTMDAVEALSSIAPAAGSGRLCSAMPGGLPGFAGSVSEWGGRAASTGIEGQFSQRHLPKSRLNWRFK